MATLQVTPEDEERALREQLARVSSTPINVSAPATGGGPAAGGSTTGGAAPAQGSGSRGAPFVGVDRYLELNRGASNALGNRVVGEAQRRGQEAQTALAKASDDFNAEVGQAEVRNDQGLLDDLARDPTAIAGNAERKSALARQRDASYGGPNALEDLAGYGDVASKLGSAREAAELSKTDAGIGQLSDRVVTGPRTAGGRSLDTQLLLADQGLRGRLDSARTDLEALAGKRDAASGAAQERVAKARETTDATREATRGALTSAQDAFERQLDETVAQTRAAATQRAQNARGVLAGMKFGEGMLPTTGAQGRYYEANDPTQGSFVDGARAGDVPEFIHNTGGQAMLPAFQQNVRAFGDAQRANLPGSLKALADLGLTPEQMSQLLDLSGVAEMATAAATGTNNVNPYGFVEDYWSRFGDPTRFLRTRNADAEIVRENQASAGDYDRADALRELAGDLGRTILDTSDRTRAGTASKDLVDLDVAGLQRAREEALRALAGRTAAHIGGNARSGSDSYWKASSKAGYPQL